MFFAVKGRQRISFSTESKIGRRKNQETRDERRESKRKILSHTQSRQNHRKNTCMTRNDDNPLSGVGLEGNS